MTSYTSNTNATWSYEYRADGMRTRKAGVGTGTVETLYLHDGQMPIEEATYSWSAARGNYSEIVRNGLGARGIDVMERVKTGTGAGTFYSYPVYDGHGNMIATLSKNGTGFSFGNQRAFDPWGTVRMWLTGGYAGFPSGRYCASIGHQMDDESGLVYMRARYYEAGSGRFISEDPAMKGGNWFAYCKNDPVNKIDVTGKDATDIFGAFLSGIVALICRTGAKSLTGATPAELLNAFLGGIAGFAAAKIGGSVTEALEVGSSAGIGAWMTGMSVGGFVNAVATLFINLLTGEDTDLGDLALAFLTGAVGAGSSYGLDTTKGSDLAKDSALGFFTGGIGELLGGFH